MSIVVLPVSKKYSEERFGFSQHRLRDDEFRYGFGQPKTGTPFPTAGTKFPFSEMQVSQAFQ